MEMIEKINGIINNFIWGPVMLILLVGTGIFLTIRIGFFQITHIKLWVKGTFGAMFKKHLDDINITPFQAVSTALASTVGTGNIVGVTTAIISGGPGALFWMWFAAFFGMVTKYSEVLLAVKFREKDSNGQHFGGPMYYLSKGANITWLGALFSALATLACFGIGNLTQINAMANVVNQNFGIPNLHTGIAVTIIVAIIIIGGIKRIGAVAEKLVPLMCLFYLVCGIIIIFLNLEKIPGILKVVVSEAFSFKQVGAGFMGYTIAMGMRYGFARGIFSNEAGMGSAPMAHASSNNKNPVEQALWGIFEVFVDTFLVCSITGIVMLLNLNLANETNLKGATLISEAFRISMPGSDFYIGSTILTVSLFLFAFTTLVGWSHYGVVSLGYLTKNNKIAELIFKIIFIILIVVGSISELELVWNIADTLNGLMAIPNLIGLLILSPVIAKTTRDYLNNPNSVNMND